MWISKQLFKGRFMLNTSKNIKSKMVQCKLIKEIGENILSEVRWIPEKFAKRGKSVKVKKSCVWNTVEGEEWDDNWVVQDVYKESILDIDVVDKMARQFKDHRKVSDI